LHRFWIPARRRRRSRRRGAGVRVVELAAFIAGPSIGMLLADHGARVVKVVPPAFGAQTESALAAWGFVGDEIASLKAHGAIGRRG